MRVLLVNKFHYRKGGSETYYFAVADALRELGHEVHFFAMEDEKNLPCEDSALFVSNRDYNGPSSPATKVFAALSIIYSNESRRRFQELCERVRPDVVHMNLVHRQITLSILDAPYLREHHVPVVWTAHDYIGVCPSYTMLDGAGNVCDACLGGHYSNCLKRKCVKGSTAKSGMAAVEGEFLKLTHAYRKIDRIICPSKFLMDKMAEGGFPREQLIWMPNFITRETARAIEGVVHPVDDAPYFLYFGRLSAEKGVDVLIEAFSEVFSRLPNGWRLKIAGTGPVEERLCALAEKSAASHAIEFLGFKSGEELRSLIKGARWSVVPSAWRENMPYAIVESLAAGTPVIGSDIGGIPELVRDGETGLTFAVGDVKELSGALLTSASLSKKQRMEMSEECKAFVHKNCAQDKYMSRLIALYQGLVRE